MSIANVRHRLEDGGTLSAVRGMRRKLTGVAMLGVCLVLTLVICGMNLLNWNDLCVQVDGVLNYIEQTDGDLQQLDYGEDEHPEMPTQAFEAFQEMPYDARYFSVALDRDGDATEYDMSSIVSVSGEKAAQMAADVAGSGRKSGFEGSYRFRVVPAEDGGSEIYFLYAYSQLRSFRSFRRASITMGLIGLLAFIAVLVPFSRVATRPVEQSQERQREFVTDASHELRTPIAIIQSAADVIEIENGESEWTQSIHNQTRRLEDLTDKLVALAKADEGARSLNLADVDVSEAALQLAEDFEPVSQAQGKPLTCDIEKDVRCQADSGMLQQALSILLDNAFKHSSEGAHVRFSVARADRRGRQGVRITVTNEADGVAAGPHPEFFGRFYKADRSRAYEKAGGGHGIGLAVVRAIAEAHGGTAEAVSDGRDVTVTLTL